MRFFKEIKNQNFSTFFKYLGPGFIVTVGFIDPGNWATNLAAGSTYGYALLWVVLLSTIILIILQYNASKLGIISGLCIAEASNKYFPKTTNRIVISSALLAVVSTLVAELLGSAIALNMLFQIEIRVGVILTSVLILFLVFTNKYHKIEGLIIGFVSLIAFSFIFELAKAPVEYNKIFDQSMPSGSIALILGVLGAVVMPHNLFLHSEFIQSRKINKELETTNPRYELQISKTNTIFAMIVGMLINAAMVILAAATFFNQGLVVDDLAIAADMLKPLLGASAAGVFALALLFAGIASSITAAMTGGILSSSLIGEAYNQEDRHTTIGILLVTIAAVLTIMGISDPFYGLIISQIILSIQLPITIVTQVKLTNNRELMGEFRNTMTEKILLYSCGAVVIFLNMILVVQLFVW
ncbi:MAG: Nramp family divalent metal transporter [Mycoplasmatales bacterium]